MSNREPKSVPEIFQRIFELREEIKEKEAEVTRLQGRVILSDEKPEPVGFDYKEAILNVFSKKPGVDLNIDVIDKEISREHRFTPDRNKILNRISYLVDNAKKLERVEGKRGFYRIKQITLSQTT